MLPWAIAKRIRPHASEEGTDRIPAPRAHRGAADLVLGCDSLVASGDLALNVMHPEHTRVIVNTHAQITGQKARAVEEAEAEKAALLERWRAGGGAEVGPARAA